MQAVLLGVVFVLSVVNGDLVVALTTLTIGIFIVGLYIAQKIDEQ